MRNGGSLVPMTEDRLRAIFKEGEPGWLEEYTHDGLNSKEVLALLDTSRYFELLEMPYPN